MQLKKIFPTYQITLKYLLLLVCFIVFNSIDRQILPYGTAIFAISIVGGFNVLASSILFILSFVLTNSFGLIAYAGITSGLFMIISLCYKKASITPRFELVFFSALALAVFILLGDTKNYIDIDKRLYCAGITTCITLIAYVFAHAVTFKRLKLKFGYEEFACSGLMVILFGVGISNATSPYVWKTLSILVLLICGYLAKKGTCTIFSALLGASLSIYYSNVNYVSAFVLFGVVGESLMSFSRYLSGILLIVIDYLIESFFGVYGAYTTVDFLSTFIGIAIFCITPTPLLSSLKDKISLFKEKQLVRVSINRNRTILSNKLYELSTVFTEMAEAFYSFKRVGLTEEKAKASISKEILTSVCTNCDNFSRCKRNQTELLTGVNKVVEIGFAKGRISLIDLPKEVGKNCIHPNNLLYALNKMLAEYRQLMIEHSNIDTGRNLIAEEARGVSEILKEIALESGTTLKYQAKLERLLTEKLMQNGFIVCELLIYGEEKQLSIGIILSMKEFMLDKLIKVITKTLGVDMALVEKFDVGGEKCYLSFKRATPYDIIYGLARVTKDNSVMSGDTHSVLRVSPDKYLVALSDGMGSGEQANNVSSTALSLIESFYKAGMKSQLILNTVSRLMSISTEENFTALDVSVIDLKSCRADFIKYGSPYGFILNDNAIRIVEGNSLPLGILDELKPSICQAQLKENDMLVLVTDGISDCFNSSGELIDYLKTLTALNPQTLADKILEKAISLKNGLKEDDMTVLAVRIYKKAI